MKTGYKNSIILTVSYFIILIQIIRIMRSNIKTVSQIARDLNLTAKIICTLMNESYEDKKTVTQTVLVRITGFLYSPRYKPDRIILFQAVSSSSFPPHSGYSHTRYTGRDARTRASSVHLSYTLSRSPVSPPHS